MQKTIIAAAVIALATNASAFSFETTPKNSMIRSTKPVPTKIHSLLSGLSEINDQVYIKNKKSIHKTPPPTPPPTLPLEDVDTDTEDIDQKRRKLVPVVIPMNQSDQALDELEQFIEHDFNGPSLPSQKVSKQAIIRSQRDKRVKTVQLPMDFGEQLNNQSQNIVKQSPTHPKFQRMQSIRPYKSPKRPSILPRLPLEEKRQAQGKHLTKKLKKLSSQESERSVATKSQTLSKLTTRGQVGTFHTLAFEQSELLEEELDEEGLTPFNKDHLDTVYCNQAGKECVQAFCGGTNLQQEQEVEEDVICRYIRVGTNSVMLDPYNKANWSWMPSQ